MTRKALNALLSNLVDDWRDCWRWFSMHAMTLALALQVTWLELPLDLRAHVPDQLANLITIGLLLFGIAGRLARQAPPRGEPQP